MGGRIYTSTLAKTFSRRLTQEQTVAGAAGEGIKGKTKWQLLSYVLVSLVPFEDCTVCMGYYSKLTFKSRIIQGSKDSNLERNLVGAFP